MSAVPGRPAASAGPGVVQVRLLGELSELAVLAGLVTSLPGVEILTVHGPRPNRRDLGERVYLTVRIDLSRWAASTRPAIPRPAITARRHRP